MLGVIVRLIKGLSRLKRIGVEDSRTNIPAPTVCRGSW